MDTPELIIVAATFLLAGAVKGVIGLGLPSVSLGILTAAIDLPTAMALLLAPSFVTNLWQGVVGGKAPRHHSARVAVSARGHRDHSDRRPRAVRRLNLSWLAALLGVLLALYSGLSLAGLPRHRSRRNPGRSWCRDRCSALHKRRIDRHDRFLRRARGHVSAGDRPATRRALVQAMGILFTLSTVMLGVVLGGNNLLTCAARLDFTACGRTRDRSAWWLGKSLRKLLSEQLFRKVFFMSLLVLGLYIITSGFASRLM